MTYLMCNKCDWIHFGVSLAYARAHVKQFNAFYNKLSKENQELFYGGHRISIKEYKRCFRCGNTYKDFREPKLDEDFGRKVNGHTVQPIIGEQL
jgi:protein-arginine kinase activator protein McsA